MLICELNSPGGDEAYLQALNLCFPGWGDEKQLAWVLERAVGGPVADRMMIRKEGTLLAGSTVSYRWLERAGKRMLVGIMTGSWTLPEARGQGCFTRIIEESVAATKRQGGALLIAFVTEDNPSFRRLHDAGAALFSTTYFQGQGPALDTGLAVEEVALDGALEAMLLAGHGDSGHPESGDEDPGRWSVVYDAESWHAQLVARAGESTALRIGKDAYAVLDRVPGNNTTRLLALYPGRLELRSLLAALGAEVSRYGHTLVGFAADPSLVEAARASELSCKPGYITAIVADPDSLAGAIGHSAPWSEQHTELAEPTSPWFLGGFAFHSGDRM